MRFGRKALLGILLALTVGLFAASRAVEAGTLLTQLSGVFAVLFLVFAFFVPATSAASATNTNAPKPVPRTLARDTLNDASLLTLQERIASAIEMSRLHSRSFGIVSLQLDCYEPLARRLGAEGAQAVMTEVATTLKRALRSTDHARLNGTNELLICLPLIAVRRDLETIAARLSRLVAQTLAPHLQTVQVVTPPVLVAPPVDAGIAMYPIDGYDGDALIESARTAAISARGARVGVPKPARRTDKALTPIRPPRKTVRAPRARRESVRAAG